MKMKTFMVMLLVGASATYAQNNSGNQSNESLISGTSGMPSDQPRTRNITGQVQHFLGSNTPEGQTFSAPHRVIVQLDERNRGVSEVFTTRRRHSRLMATDGVISGTNYTLGVTHDRNRFTFSLLNEQQTREAATRNAARRLVTVLSQGNISPGQIFSRIRPAVIYNPGPYTTAVNHAMGTFNTYWNMLRQREEQARNAAFMRYIRTRAGLPPETNRDGGKMINQHVQGNKKPHTIIYSMSGSLISAENIQVLRNSDKLKQHYMLIK